MAVAHRIAEFDIVELTEAIDDAPAGARGGVLELHADDTAMVEILEPPLDGAARIVFVPLSKLRVIKASSRRRETTEDGSFLEASVPAKGPSDHPQPGR